MSFQMQQQIKRNAEQIRTYVTDLYDWQHQMQLKQKAKMRVLKQQRAKQAQISKQLARQIQQKKQKQQQESRKIQQNQAERRKDLIRDSNTIKDYYRSWDKYNPDEQLKKLEEEQTRPYKPYNPYEHSQNYVRAKPKAKVNVQINSQRAAVIDPSQLKDKGNLHFKVCQYERALNSYTQCLERLNTPDLDPKSIKLKAVVLSNRAMTHLKLNSTAQALYDCNSSIQLDPDYVKSYLRRADCHKKLCNYRKSLEDFQKVKQLDPEDKDVDNQIKKIEKYLEKLYKEARQSLIISGGMPQQTHGTSYRIPIIQVQNIEEITSSNKVKQDQNPCEVNYLEEL